MQIFNCARDQNNKKEIKIIAFSKDFLNDIINKKIIKGGKE